MEFPIVALVLLIVAIALIGALFKVPGPAGRYKARRLMTENEAEFFGRLVVALPDHYIFPQVAMTALIEAASSNKKTAHSDRLRIAQQRADFVVCDRSCRVVAVVELDDRTHSRSKDEIRDGRLQQAGIQTVRFQSTSKPGVGAVRTAVLAAVAVEDGSTPGFAVSASAEKVGQPQSVERILTAEAGRWKPSVPRPPADSHQ